jgi:alkylation response protein AidB-like acyl-CoA dehydrogenase
MNDANQGLWIAAAEELGQVFSERAMASDRDGAFVSDNYRELKARKLMSAGVPGELGGGGASHAELCEMIRTMARHCPATALAFSMHTHLVAAAVWRHRHGQPAAALLSQVAKGELVLVSTGAGDWLDSTGTATRVDGGFRVTANKRFASGSPAGDLAITSAPHDDPAEGALVLHFVVPLSAEGVRVGNDWDTLGMRATGSHTLALHDVFVPDAAIVARRPRGKWVPMFDVICAVALPIFSAPYIGLAETAAAVAREAARRRSEDPHLPYLLGEMENALATAQMAWREMVEGARNYDFLPEVERSSATLMRKTIATEAVERCVKKAVESTGGAAFFRKHPLEKLWRDAQGMQFHPLPAIRQLHFTGRLAMGLPPVIGTSR